MSYLETISTGAPKAWSLVLDGAENSPELDDRASDFQEVIFCENSSLDGHCTSTGPLISKDKGGVINGRLFLPAINNIPVL